MLITHLRAKVEMQRQPHLRDRAALVVDRSGGRPLVVDSFPAANGVAPGMTLEQALARNADSPVLEADEAAYRRVFHRVLLSLQEVSDRVEGAGLGTAYVRLDGLEALYGGEDQLVAALLGAVPRDLKPRAGVGDAKFPAFVAARISPALGTTLVPPDVAGFLAPCPVDLLPVPVVVMTEMRRFCLRTLGDVAAMQRESLTDRFGHAGARAWELSMGWDNAPLIPMKHEESVVEHATLPFASASLGLLLAGVDTLLQRAYARPRMGGRYAGAAHLECVLYQAHPWEKQVNFKQPVGDWQRASGIIRGHLEADHPRGPVEEVTLSLRNITGESGVQLALLPNARHDREGRLADAERQLQARMGGRPGLYRVVELAPWHPAPEMRAVQVPIDPSAAGGMKPLSTASPATVQEGVDRQPAAVRLGDGGTGWPALRICGASTCGGCPGP